MVGVAGVLGWMLGARPAAAQSAQLKAQAKAEVEAGIAAQEAGQFDEAIAHFGRAYELAPHPQLLFNLGQAHRLKGDAVAALDYYRKYLVVDPKGKLARVSSDWVTELEPMARDQVRREEERAQAQAAREEEARRAAVARANAARAAEEARRADGARRDEEDRRRREEARRGSRRTLMLGLGGGAVAALSASLAFELWGRSVYADYERAPGGDAGEELYDKANFRRYVAQGLLVAGVASGVAAGALWIFSKRKTARAAKQEAPRAAPLVSAEIMGVAVTGGF